MTEATLYFSALGVGSISSLLPCVGLSCLITFGPFCKESDPFFTYPIAAEVPLYRSQGSDHEDDHHTRPAVSYSD
jgi:hypothetical protein